MTQEEWVEETMHMVTDGFATISRWRRRTDQYQIEFLFPVSSDFPPPEILKRIADYRGQDITQFVAGGRHFYKAWMPSGAGHYEADKNLAHSVEVHTQ